MPENFPQPIFVEDKETENNTDRDINHGVEKLSKGGLITSPPLKIHQTRHLCIAIAKSF